MNKEEFEQYLKENIDAKFWHEYVEADALDRKKLLKNIVENIKRITNAKNVSEKEVDNILSIILLNYFDDLINYMCLEVLENE